MPFSNIVACHSNKNKGSQKGSLYIPYWNMMKYTKDLHMEVPSICLIH